MTLTTHHLPDIHDLLFRCGVSPFNTLIFHDGRVLFYSHGLKPHEVERARHLLCLYLMRQATLQKAVP